MVTQLYKEKKYYVKLRHVVECVSATFCSINRQKVNSVKDD